MTKGKGVARSGVCPRSTNRHGARRQLATTELFCSAKGTPGRRLCRPRVRVHDEAVSRPCGGNGQSHPGLIQRDLPACHRHRTWQEWCGAVGSVVRGRPTTAPPRRPSFAALECGVKCGIDKPNCANSEPVAGQSAVVDSASDALVPTTAVVGSRAAHA